MVIKLFWSMRPSELTAHGARGDSHPSLTRPKAAAAIVKYALSLSLVCVSGLRAAGSETTGTTGSSSTSFSLTWSVEEDMVGDESKGSCEYPSRLACLGRPDMYVHVSTTQGLT